MTICKHATLVRGQHGRSALAEQRPDRAGDRAHQQLASTWMTISRESWLGGIGGMVPITITQP